MSTESTAGVGDHPASASTTIEDLNHDVLTRALRRMDGPTLAAVSCASSHLRSVSSHNNLWRDLCLSTWPSLRLISSLPNSHRSFFSDAYPSPSLCRSSAPTYDDAWLPNNLISAIDLYHRGVHILSSVVETDASSPWFRGSPFRIDGLDRKDPHPAAGVSLMSTEELTLSWVVIDPAGRRAVNVSSRRPVAVERHWYSRETLVRFAMLLGEGCPVVAMVTCGEETGQVLEDVSLTVEDTDGICMNGRSGLVILKEAMEGSRRRVEEEEAQWRYAEHVRRKQLRKEQKIQRELMLDSCCSAVGVLVLLAFMVVVALR